MASTNLGWPESWVGGSGFGNGLVGVGFVSGFVGVGFAVVFVGVGFGADFVGGVGCGVAFVDVGFEIGFVGDYVGIVGVGFVVYNVGFVHVGRIAVAVAVCKIVGVGVLGDSAGIFDIVDADLAGVDDFLDVVGYILGCGGNCDYVVDGVVAGIGGAAAHDAVYLVCWYILLYHLHQHLCQVIQNYYTIFWKDFH